MAVELKARINGAGVDLFDPRTDQVLVRITSSGITFDGATQTVTPADGSVTATKLASNAVTTAKIADAQVTAAKLAASLGATAGPFTTVSSIQVVNGIVTALTGS